VRFGTWLGNGSLSGNLGDVPTSKIRFPSQTISSLVAGSAILLSLRHATAFFLSPFSQSVDIPC